MWQLSDSGTRFCDGISRRSVLQAGGLGCAGLLLSDVLRLRAAAGTGRSQKSVIMVCLNGGPSHIDTFDMKPEAPADYRGLFQPVATNVPGIDICEKMPQLAQRADRLAIVRSLKMLEPSHQLHEVYTGFPTAMQRPAFGSVVSRLRGRRGDGLPQYVSLSLTDHPRTVEKAEQPTYLGLAHVPFEPSPESLDNLGPNETIGGARLQARRSLLEQLDGLRRQTEGSDVMAGQDAFAEQALDILTSSRVRDAFDISREPESVRRMYGEDLRSVYNYQFGHTWRGTFFLQARRLVEAGVPVVTLAPGAWDDHGENNGIRGGIFDRLGEKLPRLDHSLSALLDDLRQRGLERDVLVVMWGEFGRTPRVNKYAGRDHWLPASFAVLAGGGLPTGQVIGATDRTGSQVVSRVYGAQDVLAVVYRHLGIDPGLTFPNFAGRPQYVLERRDGIAELS